MELTRKIDTIKENHLFSRLYSKGKSLSGHFLAIYFMKNFKDVNSRKIGITVSKSRGNAVIRNRTRRRIKESLRFLYPCIKEGYLIVIVARQSAVNASFNEISDELSSLLIRASLLVH